MEHVEQNLIGFLSQFATDHKKELMEKVLSMRTRHLTVVLEDLFQSQNASAVVRTCECLGIQDIHVVEQLSKYGTNKKVLKGSHFWVDIIKHKLRKGEGIIKVLHRLKEMDYKILVTSLNPGSVSIYDIDIHPKMAIVFGNELRGASLGAMECADDLVHIPMVGFTESFNVSVSAAICLSALREKLMTSKVDWQLTEAEKNALRLKWLRIMIKKSDVLEREYMRSND